MGERDSRSKLISPLGVVAPIPRVSRLHAFQPKSRLSSAPPTTIQESSPHSIVPSPHTLDANDSQAHVDFATQEHGQGFSDVLGAIPSWMISMVVHVAILLILALCTLSLDEITHDQIVMDISEDPVEMTSALMEVSLAESELEDSLQSLETPDGEPIEFEDIMLEPEFNNSSEMLEMPNELIPIDLPEFRTAEEKMALRNLESQADQGDGMNASGQGNPSAGKDSKGTDFFGTKSYGSRFVFVIDGSSSMMHYRWLRATQELISTINELDKDQEFLVLVYNTSTAVMFNMRANQAALISATAENKRRTKIWLGNRSPRGGTLPAQTMKLALSLKPDAIYFLSDGELGDDTMFLLKNWNSPKKDRKGLLRQIPIHTVLLGSRFGFLTMKTIADQNNGIFTAVQ